MNKNCIHYAYCTLLFLCFSIRATAQDEKDKIHLTDGSVLVGQILEDNDYYVKMVLSTGDTVQVGYKKIIPANMVNGNVGLSFEKLERTYKEDGIAIGLWLQSLVEGEASSSFGIEVAKRFNSRWNAGLHLGYAYRQNYVHRFGVESTLIEVGGYGRYYLTQGRPRLFLDASAGWMFNLDKDVVNPQRFRQNNDAPFLNIGGGVHFASRRGMRFLISGGVHLSNATGITNYIDQNGGDVNIDWRIRYRAPYLKFTFEF